MNKKVIKIDEEKCVGCGLCANTCKQSAIEIIDGKAKVTRKDSCDGIGNCLPVCPVNAISFSEKDTIKEDLNSLPCKCPSSNSNELKQWPIQIKLVSENAPFLQDSHLLIAADCTAYTYGNFHTEFMNNKVILIGCPKLDEGDYTDKLCKIITNNHIKSITVVRMEVPCCSGIELAAKNALKLSKKHILHETVTISTTGYIL